MYLRPLADKFARLVLQLLARYTFWVADGIAAKGSGGAGAPSQDGPASAQVLWRLPICSDTVNARLQPVRW